MGRFDKAIAEAEAWERYEAEQRQREDEAERDRERQRIIQSNLVANIVIDQITKHAPHLFTVIEVRYGIADALWEAGYRMEVERD